jgi:hypothetical protein
MKAFLKFDFPDDRAEYEQMMNGPAAFAVLQDFDNYLRGIIKHTDIETMDVQELRDKFHEMCDGLDIWS